MKKLIKIATVMPVLLALLLAGCSLDDPADPTGQVNPAGVADAGTRYVAIGNSLTAGYMDGGLMQAGQINSYPRLIANQLGLGTTAFSQPWIAAPGIGSSAPSDPSMVAGVLHFDGQGIAVLGETALADVQSTLLLAVTQPTPYHNLGVPGALLTDGLNAYDAGSSATAAMGAPNPFFDFINRSSFFGNTTLSATLPDGQGGTITVPYESGSMVYKAIAKGGALATVWLGNNDVLGAATSGNPNNPVPITDPAVFAARYQAMLMTLAGGLHQRNGFPATIVTATVPSITSAPYFMPEPLFDSVVQGQIGASWPGGYEEADVQIVRFPTLSWIAANAANPTTPIPSTFTLTGAEVQMVNDAVTAYNTAIKQISAGINASGIAKCGVMDAYDLLGDLSATQKTHFMLLLSQTGDITTAAAMTAFSLDGIHPNNVGYGIVANGFIERINDLDGTSIPDVDLGELSWDPTYGVVSSLAADVGGIRITPAAATGMAAIFH